MKKNKAPQANKAEKQKIISSQKVSADQHDHQASDAIHATLAAGTQASILSKQLKKNAHHQGDAETTNHLPGEANAELIDAYAAIEKQLSDSDNMQFLAAASGDASASANATNNKGDKDKVVITQDSGRGNHNYLLWLLGGGLLIGGAAAAAGGGGSSSSDPTPPPPPTPGKITNFETFCDNAVTSLQLLTGLKTFTLGSSNVPTGYLDVNIDTGVNRPDSVAGVTPTNFLNNNSYHVTSYANALGVSPVVNPAGLAAVLQNNQTFGGGNIDFNVDVNLDTTLSSQDKVIWMHEVSAHTTADTGLANLVSATIHANADATNRSDAEIGICSVNIDVSGKTEAFASASATASASQGATARVIIEDLQVKASVYNSTYNNLDGNSGNNTYGGSAEARLNSIGAFASQSAEAHVTVDSALVSAYLGQYGVSGEVLADMGRNSASIIANAYASSSSLDTLPTGNHISEATVTIGNLDIHAESFAVDSYVAAGMAIGYSNSSSASDVSATIEARSTGTQNYVITTSAPIPGFTPVATDTTNIPQALHASVTIGNINISATADRASSLAYAGLAASGYDVLASIGALASFYSSGSEEHTSTLTIGDINISATGKMVNADAHAIVAASGYASNKLDIYAEAYYNGNATVTIHDINITATTGLPNSTAHFDSGGRAVAGLAGNTVSASGYYSSYSGVNISAIAGSSSSSASEASAAYLTIGNINIEAHSHITEGTANNHDDAGSGTHSAAAFMAANANESVYVNIEAEASSSGDSYSAVAIADMGHINIIATAEGADGRATAFVAGNNNGTYADYAELEIEAEAFGNNTTANLTIQSFKVSASAPSNSATAAMVGHTDRAKVVFTAYAEGHNAHAALDIVGNIDITAQGPNEAGAAMIGEVHGDASIYFSAFASENSNSPTLNDTSASVHIGNINIGAIAATDDSDGDALAAMMARVENYYYGNNLEASIDFRADAHNANANLDIGSVNVDATGYYAQAGLISTVTAYNNFSSSTASVNISASGYGGHADVNIGTIHVEASGYDAARAGGVFGISAGEDADVAAQVNIHAGSGFGNADVSLGNLEVIAHAQHATAMIVGQMSNTGYGGVLSASVNISSTSYLGQSNVDIGSILVDAEGSGQVPSLFGYNHTKAFMAGEIHGATNYSVVSDYLSARVNIGAHGLNIPNVIGYSSPDSAANVSIDEIKIMANTDVPAFGGFLNTYAASAFMAGNVFEGEGGGSPFSPVDLYHLSGDASVNISATGYLAGKASVSIGNIDITSDVHQQGIHLLGEDFISSRAFMAGDALNNKVEIHASATDYSGIGGPFNLNNVAGADASVTIDEINIKASSNASGYSGVGFGRQIDAFVVGASGYGNGANLSISAVNSAGPASAANIHIGNLDVTASAEAGFSGDAVEASLVNTGDAFFFGGGSYGEDTEGRLLIGAYSSAYDGTANVDISSINVKAHVDGSGYAFLASASLVKADHATAYIGAQASNTYSAEASLDIGSITLTAGGAAINSAIALIGDFDATLSIGARESDLNNQAKVSIGSIDVEAHGFAEGSVLGPIGGFVNVAGLAAAEFAHVNFTATSYGVNGGLNKPHSLASLNIDEINVTADGSGYLSLAFHEEGVFAQGVMAAYASLDGNAEVTIGNVSVEASGGQGSVAGLALGYLTTSQNFAASVSNYNTYGNNQAGHHAEAHLKIGDASDPSSGIHVLAETGSNTNLYNNGSGYAVAGIALGAQTNNVNVQAYISSYVTHAEASVDINEITIHATNHIQNLVSHSDNAFAGLAIGTVGNAFSATFYDAPHAGVHISASVTNYVSSYVFNNHQQDVEATVNIGNIDISAQAVTGQADAAFAMNALEAFNLNETNGGGHGIFSGTDQYAAEASVEINAFSEGYGDSAIANVTIGNISIEASSDSALTLNHDNYGPLSYGAGAGFAINAAIVNHTSWTSYAPNSAITFDNVNQSLNATNYVALGAIGYNDGQASLTLGDITIAATSLEDTALAAVAGNAYASSDVNIGVYNLLGSSAGDVDSQQSFVIDTTVDANAFALIGAQALDHAVVNSVIGNMDITATSDSPDEAAIAGIAIASHANNFMSVTSYASINVLGDADTLVATAHVDIQASAYATVTSYLGASAHQTSHASLTIQDIHIHANSTGVDGFAMAAMAASATANASAFALASAKMYGENTFMGEDQFLNINIDADAYAGALASASVNAFVGAAAFDSGVAEVDIGNIHIEASGHYAIAALGALANASASVSANAYTDYIGITGTHKPFNRLGDTNVSANASGYAYANVDVQVGAFATDQAIANLDIASITLEATGTSNGSHTGRAIAALGYGAHASGSASGYSSYAEVDASVYARAYNNANVDVNIGYSEVAPLVEGPTTGISLTANNEANGDANAFLAGGADNLAFAYILSSASDNGAANLAIGTLHIEATAANGDAVAALASSALVVEANIIANAIETGQADLTIQGIELEATSLRGGSATAGLIGVDYSTSTAHIAAVAQNSGIATLTINDGITIKAISDTESAFAGMYNEGKDAVMKADASGDWAQSELNILGDINISAYAKMFATASISAIQAYANDFGQANITLGGHLDISATSTAYGAQAGTLINAVADNGGIARIDGGADISISAHGKRAAEAYLYTSAYASNFLSPGNEIASITVGDINVSSYVTAQVDVPNYTSYALLGIRAIVGEDSVGSATITAGNIHVHAGAESGNTFAGLDIYASAYESGYNDQHASFHLGDISITNSATMTGYQYPGFAGNLNLAINNYDGDLSTVGNIDITLGSNLNGYAEIGSQSSGYDAHTIAFGNVEIHLGHDSYMSMYVDQSYVTSTASRDLTITGGTGSEMLLKITGDATDNNAITGSTASYGFNDINLDAYQGSFDLVINDAGNVSVDGNVDSISFGSLNSAGLLDGSELGISHLTISGFDSNDTITFDFDPATNVNVNSGGFDNFVDIANTSESNIHTLWSEIQTAMVGLDGFSGQAGFVYDQFDEVAAGNLDINGDGNYDNTIGVLAYGSNSTGITSVIFLENPATHILASQIYVDQPILP